MICRMICAATIAALPLQALAAVEIRDVTSPGGIDAWLVEEHSIPFTAIELRFEGGANLEPLDKRGATNLMMALLEEGSGDMDSQAFAEAAETLSARMSFDTNNDSVSINFSFLTENRDESVDLLRTALLDPTFDPDAVERVRDQVLAGLAASARDPDEIASNTLAALSFPDHPYGLTLDGTPDTVAALTVDDLRAAHRRALTRDTVKVGVTGDITAEDLGPLLDRLLGGLPERATDAPEEITTAVDGGITVVDFPSPQSVVLFGHDGIAFEDPDYIPAFILNHVLGGSGFSSRLMQEVREERGLTYGIGTFLAPRDLTAQVLGQFASSNDKAAEAIEIIRAQWGSIADNGISEEELERAKTFLTGAYPLRFDGNSRIAGILTAMQSSGLPIDYIETRNDKVNAVTLDEIKRVAARLLNPEALHFVVVGQPENLESKSF